MKDITWCRRWLALLTPLDLWERVLITSCGDYFTLIERAFAYRCGESAGEQTELHVKVQWAIGVGLLSEEQHSAALAGQRIRSVLVTERHFSPRRRDVIWAAMRVAHLDRQIHDRESEYRSISGPREPGSSNVIPFPIGQDFE